MRMLGLSNPVLWITWFIKQFLYLLIPTVVVAILMKYCNVFPHSNAGAIVILMVAYLLSLLSFCFLIRFCTQLFNIQDIILFVCIVFGLTIPNWE